MVGAVAASASTLMGKKNAGSNFPGVGTSIALASETPSASGLAGAYSDRYVNLLSPLKIGNVVLKNRMIQTPSIPRNLLGPEDLSADQMIGHYANIAKNGCGICFVEALSDTKNEAANRYHAQMLDAIHFSGALACTGASRSAEGPMPTPVPPGAGGAPPQGGMPGGTGGTGGTGGGTSLAFTPAKDTNGNYIVTGDKKYDLYEGVIVEKNATYLGDLINTPVPAVNNGMIVTLTGGTVWTVADTSYLTRLTIEDARIVAPEGHNVIMTVNGKETKIESGKTYTGDIVLSVI
jgi:hypothetical protein